MPRLDLTVLAIPAFIGAMGAEYAWQRRHPAAPGEIPSGRLRAQRHQSPSGPGSTRSARSPVLRPWPPSARPPSPSPRPGPHRRAAAGSSASPASTGAPAQPPRPWPSSVGMPFSGTRSSASSSPAGQRVPSGGWVSLSASRTPRIAGPRRARSTTMTWATGQERAKQNATPNVVPDEHLTVPLAPHSRPVDRLRPMKPRVSQGARQASPAAYALDTLVMRAARNRHRLRSPSADGRWQAVDP